MRSEFLGTYRTVAVRDGGGTGSSDGEMGCGAKAAPLVGGSRLLGLRMIYGRYLLSSPEGNHTVENCFLAIVWIV